MPEFLTATLYAPLASFGGLAVGERRGSEVRPTRSCLTGLLGAALGIDRLDDAGQAGLANYGFATMTLASGRPMTDYHTAQMPSQKRNRRFRTRAAELAVPKPELNTVLTTRDYRTDALFSWAIWPRDGAPWPLQQIADKLRYPHYALSLGRKSCPLGLPLAPALGEFPTARAALSTHWAALYERERSASLDVTQAALPKICKTLRARPLEIAMDRADAILQGEDTAHILFLRDAPLSRRRWQFALREEAILK
jgi:CRISPR system Cascade subunit CasD